jgi:hypothetical protein
MIQNRCDRRSERGSAGTKFLAVFAVLLAVANAGFNYIPVAYEGENFKQEMQTAVVNGMALPPNVKPVDSVKARIEKAAADNDIPKDMVLDVKMNGQTVVAHVSYNKPIAILPFGAYTYNYQFNHTAMPVGYLMKDSH